MEVKPTIQIDLSEYGSEGIIEMAQPSLRKKHIVEDKIRSETLKLKREGLSQEDIKLAVMNSNMMTQTLLMYVRSAPFDHSRAEAFMDFCDELDESTPGAATSLYERMTAAVSEIDKGVVSPFASSQEQTTIGSE